MAIASPRKTHILVIDDEPAILRALRSGLAAQGYEVTVADTGENALRQATSDVPDLVILDLMLPGEMSGLDVCRRLREWSAMPILVLSALGQERQKVAALDEGADDYLTKPFGMDELTARVRAALRRSRAPSPDRSGQGPPTFASGSLMIDYGRRTVTNADQELHLTPLEYEILRCLTQNADRVVTHRLLLTSVWGAEYAQDTQLLRVHVGHLRRKIEADPARPRLVVTEPGVGYRFRSSDDSGSY